MPSLIKGRYEIRRVLGQGGMGVVYEAYDKVVKRGVALKTIRDIPSRAALDLFYKECDVLASMSHPNIVEIFDIGEFEEDGASKPYFVMPLLPGKTLDELIRSSSSRLTMERSVEILSQTCRGLQAAHERGLVHRDLKPSNIFVMEDDSVKVIDFGVAHMADAGSTMGHKGTLLYMAPEQVEMKPASAMADIFSLGVVAFETLTLRHPFERGNASEVASAILKHIPPPVSEINPAVNATVSRVVHKAMAKQPWYRFATAREFGDALQKSARNEPIEMFDPIRIQPRIQRAAKAFEQNDLQFADEILSELEAEGHVDAAMSGLRRQLDQAQRQKILSQLLESARTRAEEEEYPLALQKLQELLALDPAHGPALALKNSIENKRSQRKIEDWFRLARQHMEQNAYGHARQALQNVLQLVPHDSRALQLVAEVDRREQEFQRARKEKEELYAKAVEAWQSGEVSAALSKLERLVDIDHSSHDTGTPERSAAFQNFYNQVRSEHDSIKSSYEQARRQLVDGNFDAALRICNEQLSRHPGQALFQALKFDVEERQRQELSGLIAAVDRQVEAEPDLEKRVNILAEALERYPGESHFERSQRTMRDKRDLVNSIVSKARAHEERSQFPEALAQWEILRTIYSQYPGLDFEMDTVRRRRDQQVRNEAKVRWVEQVDWQLGAGDYARAQELLHNALGEFPDDSELAEMQKLAAQGLSRSAEAQKLLAEGQALCGAGKFEEGTAVLAQAQELDQRNPAIRGALTATLVQQARLQLDSDWEAADGLAQQALALDPANAQAKNLRTLALDRKREKFVDQCVAQARRLQTDGQFEAALRHVDQGLGEFPREMRLAQLRSTLMKAYTEEQDHKVTRASALSPPKPVEHANTQTVVAPPPAAAALSASAMASGAVAPPPVRQTPPPTAAPTRDAPTIALGALSEPAPTATPEPPVAAPPPAIPAAPPPLTPPAVAARPPKSKSRMPLIAAGVGFVLCGAALIAIPRLIHKPAPAPAPPPQAAAPVTPPVEAPVTSTLRVAADLEGGKFALDDQPPADLQDGQISLDNVSPGAHTVKITGPRVEAVIAFQTAAGAPPVVQSVTAKEILAVTVAGMGGRARVQSSSGSSKVGLDGKPVGDTGQNGLDLNDLTPGNHELTIGEDKDKRSMLMSIGSAPMLMAFLKTDRNVGTLLVTTGEDGVRVFLNGKEYRRQTQRGQLRIPNLDVKEYSVRVTKAGFLDIPEQRAAIRKGEEAEIRFQLRPQPQVASLVIQGASPGTQVLLDQNRIGTVQDDGSFNDSSVPPGDHTLELRKEFYKPRKLEKHFEAGAAVQLAAADVALEKLASTLKLTVAPSDARVTIARAGEAPKPVSGSTLTLNEGTYAISAHAPNYADRTVTVSIAPGESKSVEISLVKAAAKSLGMADWDEPAGWVSENGWFVRKGGDFVGYKPEQISGTLVFTADLRKGKRLQWVASHADNKNYVLFQIDKKSFYRVQVVNGKETQLRKASHAEAKQNTYTLQMEVTAGSVVHRLYDGSKWVELDAWEDVARSFNKGKFGFLIPGGDVVALSNFAFTAK